jgi:molecular chaperone DnaK
MHRIALEAKKAKERLSSINLVTIEIPFLTYHNGKPVNLNKVDLTLSKFNELTKHLLNRTIAPIESALKEAGAGDLKHNNINEVILVGGSTKMKAVFNLIEEYFPKKSNSSVHPDEVVAIGAAIQAGVLSGDVEGVLLLDVTPLTLGIETQHNVSTPLIKANTHIPTSKTEIFSTAMDNQPQVEINVLQGQRPQASQNKSIGRFVLDGIEPAPRGIPQIEVTFEIDVNGIISVSAKDKKTNKERKIVIKDGTSVSKEEAERQIEEAKKFVRDDEEWLKNVELLNTTQRYVYEIDKALEKIKPEEKESEQFKQIITLRDEISEAINKKDYETLGQKKEVLEKAFQTAMDAMYKAEAEVDKNKSQESTDSSSDSNDSQQKNDDDAIEVDSPESEKK